jgi:transaldolase
LREQAWDCHRAANLQSLSPAARLRWLRLANAGARPQRLLWASTGTKNPAASDVLYIKALAAPFTVNTIPDKTLLAFADHGSVGELMEADGGDAEEMIAKFAKAGVDCDKLATDLQREAAGSFVTGTRCLFRLHRRSPDRKLPGK